MYFLTDQKCKVSWEKKLHKNMEN